MISVKNSKISGMHAGAFLSTLWIYILFSILFRDIHEFVKASYINEVLTGTVNGNQITDELLLIGFFVVQIPIIMVVLSRTLKPKMNQITNMLAAGITGLVLASAGLGDADDIAFMVVELAALMVIVYTSWSWKKDSKELS